MYVITLIEWTMMWCFLFAGRPKQLVITVQNFIHIFEEFHLLEDDDGQFSLNNVILFYCKQQLVQTS